MDSTANNILVWTVALHRRPSTLREYQRQSHQFLAGLQGCNSDFERLSLVGIHHASALSPDLAGLEDAISTAVFDEDHCSDYLHLDTDGELSPRSLSKIGFAVTYGLAGSDSEAMLPIDRGGMRLRLQGSSAGIEPETTAVLEFSRLSSSFSACDANIRRLFEYFVTNWECGFGGVSNVRYQRRVRGAKRDSYAGQWLFYLPLPHLARCLPPDIRHEPFANGVLIETTPHLPDADNPADIAAGERVREVLDEFGLVNDATYAIEGWPPDVEETSYEQFISGAPADRKYMVHCINFDGYDPDRKVLLYAKLFRRLTRHPKAWGLRGWDGPVLNEAKRQVRAAAKAGGVPIEWHIGLEEPAEQVRQLLADYTDITEQQLRVIYTPLQEALATRTY